MQDVALIVRKEKVVVWTIAAEVVQIVYAMIVHVPFLNQNHRRIEVRK